MSTQPKKYTLLVVDDEEGPRQSIRMVFRNEYTIHLADSGERALEIAEDHPIDLAVVDIRMAGISGIEVLQSLKKIDSSTEVIMLTAYETLETARQALRLGARDYIGKPFDVDTLRRAVSTALVHRKVSRQIATVEKEFERIAAELQEVVAREDMTRTINEVYAGVLHDINNPLTIINCFLDLVQERLAQAPHLDGHEMADLREQISTIGRQIKICCDISSRHLDFLRRAPDTTPVASINLVLADLREMMKVHPVIRTGEVSVSSLADDAVVRISASELSQILLNLMINALQSSEEEQTIEVKVEKHLSGVRPAFLAKKEGTLLLHGENLAGPTPMISVTVKDRAGGIPPELMNNIFEPYFTTKGRDKGTGLGLAVVSRLLKSCGGGLHLETAVGKGSAFTVFLPVADEQEQKASAPEREAPAPLG